MLMKFLPNHSFWGPGVIIHLISLFLKKIIQINLCYKLLTQSPKKFSSLKRKNSLVGKKILCKSPIDTLHCYHQLFMPQMDDFSFTNYSNSPSLDTRSPPKNCSINLHIVTHLCQFLAQNSKIWEVKKIDNFLPSQKLALHGPANSQLVTYSKIQTKVCKTPQATPML